MPSAECTIAPDQGSALLGEFRITGASYRSSVEPESTMSLGQLSDRAMTVFAYLGANAYFVGGQRWFSVGLTVSATLLDSA